MIKVALSPFLERQRLRPNQNETFQRKVVAGLANSLLQVCKFVKDFSKQDAKIEKRIKICLYLPFKY